MSVDAIEAARSRTEMTLAEMRRLLNSCNLNPAILTVAVSGSLGRLEQTTHSDADVIVVLRDPVEDPVAIVRTVWQQLEQLGLRLPKTDGIFSTAVTRQQLCETESLGMIDEDMAVFGLRMQLLLDSRAVLHPDAFRDLQRGIIQRFAMPSTGPNRNAVDLWRHLIDDLLRYHRSLSVRYQHAERCQLPGWQELQLKAKYSRHVNVVGLIFLLAESTTHDDPKDWLLNQLSLTPLERIASCYRWSNDENFSLIFSPYGDFLTALEDNEIQADLLTAAERLKSECVRFLLQRMECGDWPRRFLEHLLF